MKENPYFKFFTSEWLNGRITLEDYETQGLFINICALYWHHKGDITVYHVLRRTNNPVGFEKLTDSDIIRLSNEQNIYENKKVIIEFLDEQLQQRDVKATVSRDNGKLGGRPKKTQQVIFENPNNNLKKPNIDKIREDKNKIRQDIYTQFDHFVLTIEQFESLIAKGWTKGQIDETIDSVKNYAKNKNYKDLNLTLQKWMVRDYGKPNPLIPPHRVGFVS